MKVVVLGSGSKGNSTYIEAGSTKILIDAGLSYLQVKNRLYNQGIVLSKLDAVFITHEHTDHIGNLVTILKKTNACLYIHKDTYFTANIKLKDQLKSFSHQYIKADYKYDFESLSIVPIELSHDTNHCLGFLVKELGTNRNNSFSSITDTGYIPDRYYKILSYIKVVLIESNHDEQMLINSNRPRELIKRILSDHGHMSNAQCVESLKKFISKNNKMVILGHISEECNDYEYARKFLIKSYQGHPPFDLKVAYQYEEVPLIDLEGIEDA